MAWTATASRLLDHYVTAMRWTHPATPYTQMAGLGAVKRWMPDDAPGALAAYDVTHATELATQFGIGAVAIRNTSHFGPAGAYSLETQPKRGFIGITFCNSRWLRAFARRRAAFSRHKSDCGWCSVRRRQSVASRYGDGKLHPYNRVLLYQTLV